VMVVHGTLRVQGWNDAVKMNSFASRCVATMAVSKRQEFGNVIAKRLEGAPRSSA